MILYEDGFNPDEHFTLWVWLQSEAWPKPILPKIACFRDLQTRLTEMAVMENAFGKEWLKDEWNAPLIAHDDAVLTALRALDAELNAPSFPILRTAAMTLDSAIAAYRERIASAPENLQ